MRQQLFFGFLASLLLTASFQATASGQGREEHIVSTSAVLLDEVMAIPASQIPGNLLRKAEGIAIIPGMVKGGFVIGIRHGRGVLVTRDRNRAWKPPVFITMTGGSVGFQAGLQATDVILVFKTQKSLVNIMRGKLTLGADAAVAAGPVGRQASAATDARLGAEILSYSRSRGLFAGVSLDGSGISLDHASGYAYYRRPIFNPDGTLIDASAPIPGSAFNLITKVSRYTDTSIVLPKSSPNPPAAGLPIGNPPPTAPLSSTRGPSISSAEAARTQLVGSFRKLAPLLDQSWKEYLSLPVGLYLPNGKADAAELKTTIDRFGSVAANPRYETLSHRHEFTETYKLLRDYSMFKNASEKKIELPPPPATGGAPTPGVPSRGGRY